MNQRNFLVNCWSFWVIRLHGADNVEDFRYYADRVEESQETMFEYFRMCLGDYYA